MRYYKQISDNYIIAIGTGYGGEEITEAEYNAMLVEIRQKAQLVGQLYGGAITINEVPEAWREEVQRRADERGEAKEALMNDPNRELSLEEAVEKIFAILSGKAE